MRSRSHSPDSAVRTRIRPQFSQRTTSCGSALRTADSSLPYSSMPAALALARLEHRRAGAAGLGADPVVEARAAAPEMPPATSARAASCRVVPSAMSARASSRSCAARSRSAARLLQARLRGGQRRLGRLQALHELELLVLQVGLPPLERRQLVLEVGHLLRRDAARVEQLLVLAPRGPAPSRRRTPCRFTSRPRSRTSVSARTTSADERPLRLLGGLDRRDLGQRAPRCASCVRATSSAASSSSFCWSKWSAFTRSTYLRGSRSVPDSSCSAPPG